MWLGTGSGYYSPGKILNIMRAVLLSALSLSCALSTGQNNSQTLQAQGIARLQAVVEKERQSGVQTSVLAELDAAAKELEQSYKGFAAASNYKQAELSLIKLADCERQLALFGRITPVTQQSNSQGSADILAGKARDHYKEGARLARKTATSFDLVKALIGLALVEETQYHDYGAASTAVTEAVRAALSCKADQDCREEALEAKVALETARGELFSAASHVNGLITMLAQNPAASAYMQYSAYSDRASIYYSMADGCSDTSQKPVDLCYRYFDLCKEDWLRAQGFAKQAGYEYFVSTAQEELQNVNTLRSLTQMYNNHSYIPAGTFEPKTKKDVLANEYIPLGHIPSQLAGTIKSLAASAPSLPGPLTTYVQASMDDMDGKSDAALDGYVRAIRNLEEERQRLGENSARSSFLEDKVGFYDRPIMLLLANKRYSDAFEILDLNRARVTSDLLEAKAMGLDRAVERRQFATLAVKRANIAALQAEFFNGIFDPGSKENPEAVAKTQTRLTELEDEYEKLVVRTAREAPLVQNSATSRPTSLDVVQNALRQDQAEMLYYYVTDTALILIYIGPDSIHVRNVFLPRFALREKVKGLLDSMSKENASFRTDLANQLFLFLIQPALEFVRSDHLIVVPQGELVNLPFQALQDPANGSFAGERFEITYAPSAAILLHLKKQENLAGGMFLGAADPSLPAAPKEIADIARYYPPAHQKIVTDALIRKTDFQRWASSYGIVHLAVHGKFDGEEPLLSHVNLAGEGNEDGNLSAAEMFGLSLEHAKLVTLSACETGRVRVTRANEIQGIQQALLFAGAQGLMVSAWKVDSESTSRFMQTFYREAQSRTPSEAARLAIRALRRDPAYAHPHYWAPFLLIAR